jgi:hypothetical protein
MLNQSNQPTQFGHFSCLDLRFLTHREDLYEVTDSLWVSARFQSRVFRCHSTDGTSGRYYMSSQFAPSTHFFALVLMHLLLYPSSTHVHALLQLLL